MDWKARVELFEQLRQEHEFGVGTIAGVAAKFGVHRRMVRQAIAGALPPPRRYPARVKPKLGVVAAFIDQVLDEDRRAPRKQRHTARRIYRRILTEFPGAAVAEPTVRNHVRGRRRALGLVQRETFVPQSYVLGHEAQVDWYEAWADLGGERTRMQVFAMRSMASGAAFHRAYLHATQQAFLEAHEHAFAYFGGVFRLLRYDNLASPVRKILRGHRREETVRFVAFRSHWRFTAEFCTPGEGHEKGGVEGEGGYFRRNHFVPVPGVADLDALNTFLLNGCRADEARILDGRTEPVGGGDGGRARSPAGLRAGGVRPGGRDVSAGRQAGLRDGQDQRLLGAGPGGEGGGDRDHQPAVLRMVAGDPQPAAVQGADRPADRPCAHLWIGVE